MAEEKEAKRKASRDASLDTTLAQALNHPTRVKILAVLNERAASAKELEGILDIPMPNVAYHCRELLKRGCVEVVDRQQIRGAVKTRYRATTRMLLDDEQWEQLSAETRSGISVAAVGEVIDRASTAIQADTFDRRTDRYVVTFKFDADEQAWSEVVEIMERAFRQVSEVEASAANRTGEKFRVTVSLLSYESPRESAST